MYILNLKIDYLLATLYNINSNSRLNNRKDGCIIDSYELKVWLYVCIFDFIYD
jgi:hypothetical protein